MAEGCQKLFNTDISLPGVAGPRKGEDGKKWEQFFTPSELKIRK
jgi:nicotinamide mononucleotide (NMN) deamidase PncC